MGECLITRRGGETYKPAILDAGYPQNVTKTVIKGSTTSAAFRVLVAEAGNPASYTYQWYKDGVAVSGATGASYTISGLGETATHTVYCEVTNKGGVATSRIATLKVTQQYTPVLNSSYPANVTGAEIGGSVTFKVTIATAGVPASYTYQWYVNDSAVSGATGASYTISGLARGSYTVYCKVTNAAGTVQSRTATLTVTKLYLYKEGEQYTSLTGGWGLGSGTVSGGKGGFAANADHLSFTGKADTYWGFGVSLQKINMTDFSKLYLYGNGGGTFGAATAQDVNFTASTSVGSTLKNYSVDISGLSGSYYVKFKIGGSATLRAYQVWLE